MTVPANQGTGKSSGKGGAIFALRKAARFCVRLGAIPPLLKTRKTMPCGSCARMKFGNGKKKFELMGAYGEGAEDQAAAEREGRLC